MPDQPARDAPPADRRSNHNHAAGDGSYTIQEDGYATDRFVFSDLNVDDVTFSHNSGGDLVMTAGSETITVTDHFRTDWEDIEEITFADGTVLDAEAIRAKAVTGGSGDDSLVGFDGNDRIIGFEGDDTLTGSSGADVFVFNSLVSEGADTITDFELGADLVELAGSTYADLSFVDTGSGTRVEWDNGSVELEGIAVASLTEDQFAFL